MFARAGAVWSVVAVCAVALLGALPASAQETSRLTISGTSTVRAWSCPAQGAVKMTPGKGSPAAPGFPGGVQAVTVTVPVKAIVCETDLMNDHLRETLKANQFPEIAFQLEKYTMTGADVATASGSLTIDGVTKPIAFDVKLTPNGQNVHAAGDARIDMTQWNVAPPVIFEGMLKVGKDVRVKFDADLPGTRIAQ